MAKIILFEHANFSGKSLTLTASEPNLDSKNFNDKVSSMIIRGGVWVLYADSNYSGAQWEVSKQTGVDKDGALRNDVEWHGENDKISSIKLKSQA